jgi:predicted metal-dependent hydrolase
VSARPAPAPFPEGSGIFQRMFTRMGLRGRPPQFRVEFFPYANLTHTIRLRDDVAHVRLSDALRNAPLAVVEAAAALLLARVHRRRSPRQAGAIYRQYCMSARLRRKLARIRKRRARRVEDSPAGAHYDLHPLFDRLNRRYFDGALRRPRIGWSRRAWRSQLGCFDPALGQIVLSSRLDDPRVPAYVVEYILFHEMLHVKHPARRASCGLRAHSAQFRRAERRYPHFEKAQRFLRRFS